MKSRIVLLVAAGLSVAYLSACNLPWASPEAETATDSSAAETAQAVLTNAGPDIQATGRALQATAPLPSETPPPTSSPSASSEGPCQNQASFVDDVTIPDNTRLQADESFVKIWRLRNAGDCRWTPAYLVAFIGGHMLGAPGSVPLSTQVAPGQTVDLTVDMQAPDSHGTYQGYWKLRSPEGEYFGIGPQGDQSFWVKIVVPAPPTLEVSATSVATATQAPTVAASATPSPTTTTTASPTTTMTASPTATETAIATAVTPASEP
ncbi:MAG: NBR1-Ig-like domain-containing protein [Anaerolineales bacterium]